MYFYIFILWIFLFPVHFIWAGINSEWDTSGIEASVQVSETLSAFEDREDCNPNSSESSLFAAQKVLEQVQLTTKELFICEIRQITQAENDQISKDREFAFDYLEQKKNNPNNLSEKDHIHMIEVMIKYRLLKNKDNGKQYFVPATRHTWIQKKIKSLAKNHFEKYGPVNKCIYFEKNIFKEAKLEEDLCLKEFIYKIQPIPAPLIVSQAIEESDWGDSPLAREQNNILGLQVPFNNPSSMSNYPNCRRAREASNRCLLKFANYTGSVYEYFTRFNGSSIDGYPEYREDRLDLYKKSSDYNECEKSLILSESISFYAENEKYVNEIKHNIKQICPVLKKCEGNTITTQNETEAFSESIVEI